MANVQSGITRAFDLMPRELKKVAYRVYETRLRRQLRPSALPRHVAVLADDYRVMVVGDLGLLPDEIADSLRATVALTRRRPGMHVNVAVSYGGRHELADAVRSLLAEEAAKGTTLAELADNLEVDQISEHLYTRGQPDPDLIIRTSGEQRLSGFLMWQSAHSEFYFCEALWPDFRKVDFYRALRDYEQRERRYGA